MKDALISVIVPVYKTEKYFERCVSSIAGQTYKNLEIILVDDGSPDNCPAMCDAWAEKDSRIKVIHKENGGDCSARNAGLDIATGDYVIFEDNDDFIDPDMIEFLYNLISENEADVARCGLYGYIEKDGRDIVGKDKADDSLKLFDYEERMIDLIVGGHVSGVLWNKLYKRSILKNKHLERIDGSADDILFNYRVYKDNPKTAFCDLPKYHYVIRDNSMTNCDFGYGAFDIIRAKRIFIAEEGKNEIIRPYAIKGYIMSAFIVLSGCIRNNTCMDRYDELVESILEHKNEIISSDLYSRKDKIKTRLLSISPRMYNLSIKMKG